MEKRRARLPGPSACRWAPKKRGSILIIALWSVSLLTVFAVILGYQVRQKLALVKRLDERDKLHFIAEAGIEKAIALLKGAAPKDKDALSDEWSNNPGAFKDISLGDGRFNISYNYMDELSGDSRVFYGLIDEERKININKQTLPVMERLLRILGLDEAAARDIAASIIDWRDADSDLSDLSGGAEDAYYRNLNPPYQAKDADFQVLDELLLVKGISEDVFARVKDYATIYGDGKVNINTATRIVLLALGLNEGVVDKIIAFRNGKDGLPGTEDDNVFDTPSNIVPRLTQLYHFSEADITQLSQVAAQSLTTHSNYFMIKSTAILERRRNAYETTSVVDRKGKVLYWRES